MKRCLLILAWLCTTILPARAQIAAQSVSALPIGRSNMAVLSWHDKIYCLGGNNGEGASDECWVYDPYSDKFSDLPRMPRRRFAAGAAVCGNRILVFGGLDENEHPLDKVDAYDLSAQTWSQAATMPQPLARFGLACMRGQVYLVGGDDATGRTAATWCFDAATMRFSRGPDLPQARDRLGLVPCGSWLYALGGQDASGKVSAKVWRTNGDSWKAAPDLKAPRANMAATRLGGEIVVAGGWTYVNSAKTYVPQIEALGRDGRWSWEGRLAKSCDGCRAAAWHGRVFVFGGYDEDFLDAVQECRWVPPPNTGAWRVDPQQKVHLVCLDGTASGEPASPLAAFTAATDPDASDLTVQMARQLAWPLPPGHDSDVAFIKSYVLPTELPAETSLRRATAPFLIGESVAKGGLIVDKVEVAPRDTSFGPQHPFPPLCVSADTQAAFDATVIAVTMYIQPLREGGSAHDALEAFLRDLNGLMQHAYRLSDAGFIWHDDSDLDQLGDEPRVIHIPEVRLVAPGALPAPYDGERAQVEAVTHGGRKWVLQVMAVAHPKAK